MLCRLVIVVAASSLLGCGGGRGAAGKVTMFERVWTMAGDAPYQAGALGASTLGDDTSMIDGQVVATATGQARWGATARLIGVDGDAAVGLRLDGDRGAVIERRGLTSGAALAEVPVRDVAGQASPLRLVNAGLAVAPARMIYTSLGRVRAFALDSGREAWTLTVSGTQVRAVPSGERVGLVVGLPATELVVVDAATGTEQWRAAIDGADTDVVAAPQGGFFAPRAGRVVEFAGDGRELRSAAGRWSAASGDLLAVTAGDAIVVVDGAGQVIDQITPAGAGDFVAAPGLCGRAVVYFRSRDATVWWHPIGGGELPVTTVAARSGTVHGTPAGAAPTLTEPPRCVAGLVLVQDWIVTAYRVPST